MPDALSSLSVNVGVEPDGGAAAPYESQLCVGRHSARNCGGPKSSNSNDEAIPFRL